MLGNRPKTQVNFICNGIYIRNITWISAQKFAFHNLTCLNPKVDTLLLIRYLELLNSYSASHDN